MTRIGVCFFIGVASVFVRALLRSADQTSDTLGVFLFSITSARLA